MGNVKASAAQLATPPKKKGFKSAGDGLLGRKSSELGRELMTCQLAVDRNRAAVASADWQAQVGSLLNNSTLCYFSLLLFYVMYALRATAVIVNTTKVSCRAMSNLRETVGKSTEGCRNTYSILPCFEKGCVEAASKGHTVIISMYL